MSRSSRLRLSYGLESDEQSYQAVVCALCKYMSQVHTWQSTQAREVGARFGITQADMVCRPCRDDIRRVTANPNHNPRWEKQNQNVNTCCVEGCTSICLTHSKVTDTKTIKQILEHANLHIEGVLYHFLPLFVVIIIIWCIMLFSHSKQMALHVGFL